MTRDFAPKAKEKKRGTQNELEIIYLILHEHPNLLKKVVKKIELHQELRGLSVFQEVKRKQDEKIKKIRDKAKMK